MASASIAALIPLCVVSVPAQTAALQQRGPDSHRVVLDIVARPSLEAASAAVVTDNGDRIRPEQLRLLSQRDGSDAQPQVIFVIDAVNSNFQSVARSEDAIKAVLKANQGQLPQLTSVVILSDVPGYPSVKTSPQDTTSLRQSQLFAHRIPPSRDASELFRQIESFKVGLHRILESQAGIGQAERVQFSLEALSFVAKAEASEPGPKIVVWISPGWPFLSKSDAKSSEQLFDSIVYFSDLLRSGRIILYSVSPEGMTSQDHSAETEAFLFASRRSTIEANGHAPKVPVELTSTYYMQFLAGVRNAADSNPNDLTLQVLAYQSGGLVLQQNNDLKNELMQCISDAQNISSLAYEPDAHGVGTKYHAVQVRRSADAQPLRTRTGFYDK